MSELIKPYKKEYEYSYTSGAYATIEILKAKPEALRKVFIHSAYTRQTDLLERCRNLGIPAALDDRAFRRINQKENAYVLGVFEKYACVLNGTKPHIALVNPSDMGNLGTIIRTIVGFNITNLAIITPAADIFHPKTIRASMGALFYLDFEAFGSFDEYRERYPRHLCYPFMPDAAASLDSLTVKQPLFSLIFGNEGSGLDKKYARVGTAVRISQSESIDSLNLSVAVGIGAYAFARQNGLV